MNQSPANITRAAASIIVKSVYLSFERVLWSGQKAGAVINTADIYAAFSTGGIPGIFRIFVQGIGGDNVTYDEQTFTVK